MADLEFVFLVRSGGQKAKPIPLPGANSLANSASTGLISLPFLSALSYILTAQSMCECSKYNLVGIDENNGETEVLSRWQPSGQTGRQRQAQLISSPTRLLDDENSYEVRDSSCFHPRRWQYDR